MRMMTSEPIALAEVIPDLPAAVSDFVGRLIAKIPARRPQTMSEVSRESTALAAELSLDLDGVPNRHREICSGPKPVTEEPEAPEETRTLA